MARKKKFVQTPYKDEKVYKKSNVPFHINYSMRLVFVFVSIVFIGLVLGNFTKQVTNLYKESKFKINENGYINYDVSLKPNNFYDTGVLQMNMAYSPELVDNVNLKFNYNFNSEEYLELSFNNTIKYDFRVISNVDNSVLYENTNSELRKHVLLKEDNILFYDDVSIDYDKYRDKYNELIGLYGTNISAYVNVSNTIEKSSDMLLIEDYIKDDYAYSVKIPVTNSIFSIELNDNSSIKNESIVFKNEKLSFANKFLILTTIILCCLFVCVFFVFIRLVSLLQNKSSKYDKYVTKLLRDYDNLIVETMVFPKTEGLNKVSVASFKELLDTHDLVKKPILYYNVVSHMKCMFYILDDKDLYVYTVKEVDLEK